MNLVSADMTKALVCSMNSHVGPYSFAQKLFGDPDDYAYKFGNDTFADKLPIYLNWLFTRYYGVFHSLSIDYKTQMLYYSNDVNERLEVGLFVHNNMTTNYYYPAVPETNQVTMHSM